MQAKLCADFYGAAGFITGEDDCMKLELEGTRDAIGNVLAGLNSMMCAFIADMETESLRKQGIFGFDIL